MPYNYPIYNSPYSGYNAPYNTPQMQNGNLPQNSQQAPQSANNGIIWVQGEAGAKSFLVASGMSVLLMDSEQSRFYIKSTDTSGMPMPLRTFEYTEISAINAPRNDLNAKEDKDYVTHEELEKRLKEFDIKPARKRDEKDNG